MKEKVNQFLVDSSIAYSTGTVATSVAPTDHKTQLGVIVATILAPILKEAVLKLIDKIGSKKRKANKGAENESK